LRRVDTTSKLLIVDLGSDQVANITVMPEFENLDLTGMNLRVDHIRSAISQTFSSQTANYSFGRDGVVHLLP